MRIFIIIISFYSFSFAQIQSGFDVDEAADLIRICNSFTFLNLYEDDTTILPVGYTKTFTSDIIGMDNKFQIYTKGKTGVINFRGSTSNIDSWVENMYSAMIPAKGTMKIDNVKTRYKFAKDKHASVHAGYALAVVLLSEELIDQIKILNKKGIYDILLTGHSQGGALTNMTRAYLENLSRKRLSSKNKFKSYSFANPMCGNQNFAIEFKKRYEADQTSFRVINPNDLVPKMPMHYEEKAPLLNTTILTDWVLGKEKLDIRKLGSDLLLRGLKGGLSSYIKSSNKIIEKAISFTHVSIEMPDYVDDINYFKTGILYQLPRFGYPKISLDTSSMNIIERSKLKLANDGQYYREEPLFYQHNPYNYYVGFLKKYDSKAYRKLKVKYLEENL